MIDDLESRAKSLETISKSSMAIMALVSAGWTRQGSGWTHPNGHAHLSQAEAYATLLEEEKP